MSGFLRSGPVEGDGGDPVLDAPAEVLGWMSSRGMRLFKGGLQVGSSCRGDGSPRPDPHPLAPSPVPSLPPSPGEGEREDRFFLVFLPPLPGAGGGRGRERRAGEVRAQIVLVPSSSAWRWPRQVPLELLLAREVLHGPGLQRCSRAGPRRGGSSCGSARCGPGQGAEVGAAGGEDRVHLVGLGDVAHGDRRDAGLVADAVRERRLEHASVDGLGLGRGLARRDVDDVRARRGGRRGRSPPLRGRRCRPRPSRWPRCARTWAAPRGQTARMARKTSSGKRRRFSSGPPYSSVRRLESGVMKPESR